MLAFTIRDLESHAAVVDGLLSANDPVWEAADVLPSDSVHATGRLSAAGAGRFYWSGRIAGRAQLACRRCLGAGEAIVAEDVHLVFAEVGDHTTDDPDVFRIPERSRELDLRGAVREQWLLGVPNFPLCRDDCRGICPRCGADLNDGPCTCERAVDDRWASLRALRNESSKT